MTRRRVTPMPSALQRALHGDRPARGCDRPVASDALRPPEEWELVVAAVELAFLSEAREAPPAHLGAKLVRLLEPSRESTP